MDYKPNETLIYQYFRFATFSLFQTPFIGAFNSINFYKMHNHRFFLFCFLYTLLFEAAFAQTQQDFPNQPELHWKYSTNAPIYASPVVDDNTVYVGSLDSVFYAIDMQKGQLNWSFKTKGEIRSTACLTSNFLYFISSDGNVYCLNKQGKVEWAFSEGAEKKYDFADYHQSSPILQGNVLYFGLGNGFVYAINSTDGTLKWKTKTGGVVHGTPAIDKDKLYIGSFDGHVYALNITDGCVVWSFKTVGHRYFPKGEVQGSPAIATNAIIIGARDYNVYALDKEKGYAHWNKAFTKGWVLSNTYIDSTLYMAGADERILTSIDGKTLKENWKRNMAFLMFSKPAFSKTMLYIGTTMGKLHGIDAQTGKDKWVFATDGYKQNHLKYFKADDTYRDDIYSIITSNETFLDAEVALGGIFSTPAVYNGYILFSSTEGVVYCLKKKE